MLGLRGRPASLVLAVPNFLVAGLRTNDCATNIEIKGARVFLQPPGDFRNQTLALPNRPRRVWLIPTTIKERTPGRIAREQKLSVLFSG